MLILLDERKNNFNIFYHYGGLYNFIETQEKHRNAKRSGRKAQCWVFARHSHRRMITYQGIFSHPMAYPASIDGRHTNGWDILEIVSGDPDNPVFIPLAHNIDIEPLLKNWCTRYCRFHRYTLIEIASLMELKKLAKNPENEQP